MCLYKHKLVNPTTYFSFFFGTVQLFVLYLYSNKMSSYYTLFVVYGKYDDVTAEDFLQAQVDTTYRKEWDNTAVTLKVVDSEPKTNSDIVYWEMQWPVSTFRLLICSKSSVKL